MTYVRPWLDHASVNDARLHRPLPCATATPASLPAERSTNAPRILVIPKRTLVATARSPRTTRIREAPTLRCSIALPPSNLQCNLAGAAPAGRGPRAPVGEALVRPLGVGAHATKIRPHAFQCSECH